MYEILHSDIPSEQPERVGSSLGRMAPMGTGFRPIPVGCLIERGDEYLDEQGEFRVFPLGALGRMAPAGLVTRRGTKPYGRT